MTMKREPQTTINQTAKTPIMKTRPQINRTADNWLMADPENRAQVVIMSEQPDNDMPRLSFSAGGNRELMIQSLCETMNHQPDFTAILAEAIQRYNDYKVSQN